ncbi:serine/threonine protein phosphatase 2A 55 kDa regulatory subunit B beta isoform isoform X2 [Amborella trichopoda]|uniref:serine/threonine protein phosphatase 2A 55 kDa regulatory subunit B beta isoform isoform X2 n=1 Tax=Amborella trichopoda TaxID=13333 RepID=UPI0009C118B7|nr:serine/threonine protein phosphatase 2A 55 kDa regulatory subunit B beta isoform isoform X2 [Amborella trichopoda]|eukprot:XP_020520817.1 serine/threonine protein phosphatase 2A 55 kDa regulatory subunit B beta isoform isoform X2 [Amborella trichopoda]
MGSKLEWKFSQVFGERKAGEEIENVDIITAVEFDKSGEYIASGDRGGRVVLFERTNGKYHGSRKDLERLDHPPRSHPEYHYKTEIQSHEPEFDYLKSFEIEEKVNKVKWCPRANDSLFLLSANDKTIKLWKVMQRKVKKVEEINPNPSVSSENTLLSGKGFLLGQEESPVANGNSLEKTSGILPNDLSKSLEESLSLRHLILREPSISRCRRVYAHAHDFHINSISINSDCETFISADDLRINLWNLEKSYQCFNIIDLKPNNMEDLTEVITSAEFHPVHCNLLAYGGSKGIIRLVDMRQSALCDGCARIFEDKAAHGPRSFLTELIGAISHMKFASNGRHVLSRDYMNLKLWDLHMDSSPISTFKIHEYLSPKEAASPKEHEICAIIRQPYTWLWKTRT